MVDNGSSLVAQMVKCLTEMQETWVQSLGWEYPLEKDICLENSIDGGAWWAPVHWVTKSWTQLNDFKHTYTMYFYFLYFIFVT